MAHTRPRRFLLSLRENHEVLATEREPEGQAQRSKFLNNYFKNFAPCGRKLLINFWPEANNFLI
ncbi:MAG: hypothetical protein IKS64_03175 [Muribaculaceae bacterium]|nr:hypothetical protein [Muribaculaceae bacterium]